MEVDVYGTVMMGYTKVLGLRYRRFTLGVEV